MQIAVSKLPRTGEHLIGRSAELETLDNAWSNPKTNIVQIVAPGGVGKTQLVKKWREALLDREDHGGVVRAYDWSFYSQGTQQQASADEFFDRALRWFGETEIEKYKDPWLKGERLAQLVSGQVTLLILDGLEPLQHPPGPLEGELSDPSLQSLLRGLAGDNPGLCVVTTRETVPDLTEISEPRRVTIDLRTLEPADGAELLKLYGVHGTDEELQQASRDYEGHALALILLGTYLRDRFGGDIVQRNRVTWPPGMDEHSLPALSTDELGKATPRFVKHARKAMASYVNWFENEAKGDDLSEEDPVIARAAVAILRLMGLFNRPADAGCLGALRAEPVIPGLTEPLFAWDNRDELWTQAVLRLRAARLLADDHSSTDNLELKTDNSLDAHPLVREHFAAQLDKDYSDAASEAHRRLYEHLKQSAPQLPDNLHDVMPLYHAVGHGCKAGKIEEAWELYRDRIMRNQDFFTYHRLGAFGADLSCQSSFFAETWHLPMEMFSDHIRGSLLAIAGFGLRALGRLQETAEPIISSLDLRTRLEVWDHAAVQASNLSALSLTLGDVSSAVTQGEHSVELADRSGQVHHRFSKRTTLADALHASGRGLGESRSREAALAAFREAEAIWKSAANPLGPLLYGISGYAYCDLLLDECLMFSIESSASDSTIRIVHQVRNRAETTLISLAQARRDILSIALDHLTLGRTFLLQAGYEELETKTKRQGKEEELSALDSAARHLNESVSLLRRAGTQHHLPRGLLHRAVLWRVKYEITNDRSQIESAERDLAETERIAQRGSMLIFHIDAALERSRLALALNDREQAQKKLDETRELIKQTEKPYVPHIPTWEDWDPPEYIGVFKEGDIVGYHRRNPEIEALQQAIDRMS